VVFRLFNTFNRIKWLLLSLLIIVLVLLGLKLWRISIPGRSLYQTYTQMQTIRADPEMADLADLQPLLHQTYLDLQALQYELAPFTGLMKNLTWLPYIGGDVGAMPEFLAMGVGATEAGDIILTALEPVVSTILSEESVDSKVILPIAIQGIAQANPEFERARRSIEQVQLAREKIEVETLSPRLAKQVHRFDQVLPFAGLAFDAIEVMPHLLGATEPRTYLLIAQNNDELRATGGFMTAMGTVTVDQGEVSTLTFEDIYAIDDFSQPYPAPPSQLLRYMGAEIWVFRDANWSPDYPTAVADILNLYHVSRDTQIDGVIAVDQLALQQVVAALGPVIVSDWPEPVTGRNVLDLMRLQWSPTEAFEEQGSHHEWLQTRKNFMSELVGALRERIEGSPDSVDWVRLGQAVLASLAERHVQLWFVDPATQRLVEKQGWAGRVRPTPHDYLMVVDSNLGFNKANAVVDMSLSYELVLTAEETPEARLTVRHQNNSPGREPCLHDPRSGVGGADYWEVIYRCYWSYLRVYTPRHSQLHEATPHSIPGQFLVGRREEPAKVEVLPAEAGKSVWGTFLLVPRGQALETTFHYGLPDTVLEKTDTGWRYRLTVQKQAGTLANDLQVTLHLPIDSNLIKSSPEPTSIEDGTVLNYQLSLGVDQQIDLIFE